MKMKKNLAVLLGVLIVAVLLSGFTAEELVLSENYALGAYWFTSTNYGKSYTGEKAFDGDTSTRWSAANNATRDQFIGVDFGKEVTYNFVIIQEINYPRVASYVLQYSNDGETFHDIPGTQGTTLGAYKEISFAPVTSRYFRLYIFQSISEKNSEIEDEPTINEISVYYAEKAAK